MSELETNDQMVLITGFSATGKSAALRNLRDQASWIYANSEAGKRLPFPNKFINLRLTDPLQINGAVDQAIAAGDKCKGFILDSVTFAMDMYETQYVINATDTQKGWNNFAQFFKQLFQSRLVKFGKPTIITAHLLDVYDKKELVTKTKVPIKGSLKNNGVEAYFSTVVSTKKIGIIDLEPYKSDLLTITDEERDLGYKHVFQTRITKETTGDTIRSPMGMFTKEQTYMDNDAQLLLDHMAKYYKSV
jgi:hypothetical protein